MAKYVLEPLVVPTTHVEDSVTESQQTSRPSWQFILRYVIEPVGKVYGLDLEYGGEQAESCAIFYTNGIEADRY